VVQGSRASRRKVRCVTVAPVLERVKDFAALIAGAANDAGFAVLGAAELAGRPTADFVAGPERILKRRIARRAPARKPAPPAVSQQSLFETEG